MAEPLTRRRFTVDEYYRMAELGIFGEDDRVELLDGEIVEMPPITPPHAGTVTCFNHLLQPRVGDRAIVSIQNPVRLGPYSEPMPDVALLEWRDDFYASRHPVPEDVLLVVEVADGDGSAAVEREVKAPLYTAARVRELWIASLPEQVVEWFRDPHRERYRDVRRLGRGARIAPVALPDLELSVDEILGPH